MATFTERPYQTECIQAILDAGPGRHLIALATGLGKTVVFTHLTGVGRVLILSHRDELVRQPEKYYGGKVRFGIEKAEEHATDEEVVSASVQSLSQDSRLTRFSPDAFETIIVDEAHHAAAPTYRKILDYFTGAKRILGFTATPKRGDNVGLSCVFDDIIFSRDIRWGIAHQYLSRIRCEEIRAAYSLDHIEKTNGDYSVSQIEKLFLGEDVTVIPTAARAYLEKCHNTGRHTLIYCVTKRISRVLLETIRKMLPENEKEQVQAVFGDTSDEERAKILSDFQDGAVRCIINCMVLTEGTDLPVCDAVMNLRPTCRNTLYQQMVGRGTRLYPTKEYCLVLDIIPDTGSSSGRSLCTAPTLFGIDPFVLPPSKRAELTDDVDLLDFCDALSSMYAERSARVELLSRDVDLFLSDCETVFGTEHGRTIEACAAACHELSEKRSAACGVDFGDLVAEVFADESKRYRFRPDWEQEIWMSEPDVLDQVRVWFPAVPGAGRVSAQTVSGYLPLSDALELIQMYCFIQPDFYHYCWSWSAQQSWERMDATFAQRGKLQFTLKQQGILVTDQSDLNKLDASTLIDWAMRYKEARKMSEAFVQASSGKRTKKAAAAINTVEELLKEQEAFCGPVDESAFWLFTNTVRARYAAVCESIREMEEAKRAAFKKAMETSELRVPFSVQVGKGQSFTDAQLSMLTSLERQTGISLDFNIESLTRRQASLAISFLSAVRNMPSEIRNAVEFPDAKQVCLSAEKAEATAFVFRQVPKKKETV